MRSVRQLLRQPLKTAEGILLVAVAVAILITCVGQYVAAALTRKEMDHQYNTVALTTDASLYLEWPESGEYYRWYQNLIENYMVGDRTDIIKTVSNTGLLSAYIPSMTPDNYTQHYSVSGNTAMPERGAPYNCAVLVITLDEIGTEILEEKFSGNGSDGSHFEIDNYAAVNCKGTVEQVIALQEGFSSPEGWTIDLRIKATNKTALEAMELKIGQRYLVYGMDYYDNDWVLRKVISKNESIFATPFDMDNVYKDHPLGADCETNLGDPSREVYYYKNVVKGKEYYVPFFAESLSMFQNCSLTVCDYAALNHIVMKTNEEGNFGGFEGLTDQRVLLEDEHSDLMNQYGSTLISKEAYMQMYSIPTMAELNTSLDAFLDSADGVAWQKVLQSIEVNNHAFPVLAVDKLGYQAEFVREEARIVQGRDFTETELEQGEKVCIISESQAAAHGFTVGDTLTIQTYHHDPNITEHLLHFDYPSPRFAYPHATYYSQARGFSSEPEIYTIVGVYRLDNAEGGFSSYGFLSDTLFIPKNSTGANMVTSDEGLFQSIIIKNGMLEDFNAVLAEAGYEEMFVVYDQGYSEIFAGLNAYEAVAGKAIYVGLGAYAVMLLLYLLLFPGRQKKTLATMGSLGASKGRKFLFVLFSNLVILIPGTVLGAAVSVIVRDSVTAELMDAIGFSIHLVFGGTAMTLAVAALQLVAATVAVALCGLLLVNNHRMDHKVR